jgi:hypothetical protein
VPRATYSGPIPACSQQAADLRRKVYGSLAWIISACIGALIIITIIAAFRSSLKMKVSALNSCAIASLISFSWATLGRLSAKTWSRDTLFERLDAVIFWFLYWIGALFGSVAALVTYS